MSSKFPSLARERESDAGDFRGGELAVGGKRSASAAKPVEPSPPKKQSRGEFHEADAMTREERMHAGMRSGESDKGIPACEMCDYTG